MLSILKFMAFILLDFRRYDSLLRLVLFIIYLWFLLFTSCSLVLHEVLNSSFARSWCISCLVLIRKLEPLPKAIEELQIRTFSWQNIKHPNCVKILYLCRAVKRIWKGGKGKPELKFKSQLNIYSKTGQS